MGFVCPVAPPAMWAAHVSVGNSSAPRIRPLLSGPRLALACCVWRRGPGRILAAEESEAEGAGPDGGGGVAGGGGDHGQAQERAGEQPAPGGGDVRGAGLVAGDGPHGGLV